MNQTLRTDWEAFPQLQKHQFGACCFRVWDFNYISSLEFGIFGWHLFKIKMQISTTLQIYFKARPSSVESSQVSLLCCETGLGMTQPAAHRQLCMSQSQMFGPSVQQKDIVLDYLNWFHLFIPEGVSRQKRGEVWVESQNEFLFAIVFCNQSFSPLRWSWN